MGIETRMQSQETSYVRCDMTDAAGQCAQETTSYQTTGSVVVVADPAWLTLSWGLSDMRYFCCWGHLVLWTSAEDGNTDPAGFSGRLKAQAQHRDTAGEG